jgi:Putative zinc-finger
VNNCEIVKDLLPMYIDDLCSSTSNTLVEQHLSTCKQCNEIHTQMLKEFEIEQVEVNQMAIQQKQPFEKMKHIFKFYRVFSKILEWVTVLAVVITIILLGKGFIDTKDLASDLKHQEKIEQEQQKIMEAAFESLASEGTSGLQNVSIDYENQIKYIAVFDTPQMLALGTDFTKPTVIYPLPYERAKVIYENGKLIKEKITHTYIDVGTIAMKKDGYIVQFEYTEQYLNEVEQAFQTKYYSPYPFQLWLPALGAMLVTLIFYFLYRGVKTTNRKAQKLIA